MGFSTIAATAEILRAGNDDILNTTKYPNATLILLNQTEARAQLELDLRSALHISETDTTTLDSILTYFETRLIRALAYKQLEIFYLQNNDGEGTKTYMRYYYFHNKYNELKTTFAYMNQTKIRNIETIKLSK